MEPGRRKRFHGDGETGSFFELFRAHQRAVPTDALRPCVKRGQRCWRENQLSCSAATAVSRITIFCHILFCRFDASTSMSFTASSTTGSFTYCTCSAASLLESDN